MGFNSSTPYHYSALLLYHRYTVVRVASRLQHASIDSYDTSTSTIVYYSRDHSRVKYIIMGTATTRVLVVLREE